MTGITVTLYERKQKVTTDTPPKPVYDSFNDPVWEYKSVSVSNVLVGQPTTEEITSGIDLYGKKAEYMIGIPKGDEHAWEDADVEFFGRRWHTFGALIQGIEANVPTPWHKKVRVAAYE